jgi:hypothetical protein
LVVLGLALGVAIACQGEAPPATPAPAGPPKAKEGDPPHALRAQVDELRAGRDAPRHASDGAGRAWLESAEDVRAGGLARFTIHFEPGPLGVAAGGYVRLTVPPFWNWSDPQMHAPLAPGFTTLASEPAERPATLVVADRGVLLARIEERPLVPGERLTFVYGAGEALARVDRYAERESVFWISVDGDGDGNAALVGDSPAVRVLAGPPAQLVLTLPSGAEIGDEVRLQAALLDGFGNAGVEFAGTLELVLAPTGLSGPTTIALKPGDRGLASVVLRAEAPGVQRILGKALAQGAPPEASGIIGESNPLEVGERVPRILWGDLHGHSNLSDGTGTPEDFYAYARDVAALDVAVLTDHDHWGMQPLDSHPDLWERIRAATSAAYEPGRFVTLLGYEYTSWIHGHRHVLYFEDRGAIHSSLSEACESPLDLWAALRAEDVPALTFAHHSAGGPIPTNWDIAPDPELEPLTEIVSVHGSSEAMDSPGRIYSPVPGNFVRDALDKGYRFGFVGSGDGHDGHPGLTRLAAPSGGLVAILAEERNRPTVLQALRERRTYATNGPRMLLRAALGATRMGGSVAAPQDGAALLFFVRAVGTAPLRSIHVVRSGAIVAELDCQDAWDYSASVDLADLKAGEYVYARVVQADRGLAWSSPFYVE